MRKVLVTGASRGIGAAICRALLDEGHRVIGLSRDFTNCDLNNERFSAISIDLAELEMLASRLSDISKQHPDIDAIVLNAGYGHFGSLEEFSIDQIRRMVDTNLTSPLVVARTLLPALKRSNGGDVIVMGSEAALAGGPRGAVYSAVKFGLRGMSQALRKECAAAGIRVCIINPGMVSSHFFDELDFEPGADPDNYIEPKDVASTVVTVLSARSGTVFDEINLSPLKKVITPRRNS